MYKRTCLVLALCIASWGCSTPPIRTTAPSGTPNIQQATTPETTPRGPAATLVTNYLAAAGTLDPSATKAFLSTTCKDDIVTEFHANTRSGWSFSAEDTKIKKETIIPPYEGKATVVAQVVFKGGNPPTFMAKTQTFFLVLENGAWKISGMYPAPTKAGPGVMPLSR